MNTERSFILHTAYDASNQVIYLNVTQTFHLFISLFSPAPARLVKRNPSASSYFCWPFKTSRNDPGSSYGSHSSITFPTTATTSPNKKISTNQRYVLRISCIFTAISPDGLIQPIPFQIHNTWKQDLFLLTIPPLAPLLSLVKLLTGLLCGMLAATFQCLGFWRPDPSTASIQGNVRKLYGRDV